MMRFIRALVVTLVASTTGAMAQPVLTNGGFEQLPPNSYGNNIGWSIAPWVLTAGSTNVVSVDGPGGVTWYGNLGPASDASGGVGNPQHYFDQANISGIGTIYQEFTPLCSGEATYGTFFSSRSGATGYATVSIYDATGSTLISGPASVTVPTGNSETDPWQLAAFSTTLTAGTTYRFQVGMDNQLNMDNAYVAFGPECTEHSAPCWSTEEGCQQPEPEPVQCTPFDQEEAICDTATGNVVVTLNNPLTGTFDPTNMAVECLTPGVTVTQNPLNPLELIVSGAAAGQTVMISTSAIQDGAGAGTGLDLCCMGEMEIIIPEELSCEPPVDVSIEKEWVDIITDQPGLPPHGFEIIVDLESGTLNPGDVITVDDPASGQINVTPFGSPYAPAPWTCARTGGSWSCQYVVPSTGAVLPATIIYPSIIDGSSHVKNCATVSAASANGTALDVNLGNNESCWEINIPDPDAPTVEIVKTGPSECPVDAPCDFTVTLTNTGGSAYTGNILLQDQTNVSGFDVTNVSPMPPGCGGNLPANPFACVVAMNNFGAGASQTYTITIAPNFPGGQVVADSGENCADAIYVPDTIPTGDYSWSYYQDGIDAMPANYQELLDAGQPLDQSCVIVSTDVPDEETPTVSVEKTCSQLPSMGAVVYFQCQIQVSASGPVSGTITLDDVYSYPAFNGDPGALTGQLGSGDPWSCATAPYSASNPAQCSISGADLNAAGGVSLLSTSVMIVQSDLHETNAQNCATVALDGAASAPSCAIITQDEDEETGDTGTDAPGELTINKACSPRPVSGETQIPCQITVTANGPISHQIYIVDEFTFPGYGGDPNSLLSQLNGPTGAGGWTCSTAPYNNSGNWAGCQISGADFAAMGNTATFTTFVTVNPDESSSGLTGTSNCALVGMPDVELGRSCVDIAANNPVVPQKSAPQIDTPTGLTVGKTSTGPCTVNVAAQTYDCGFELSVQNNSATPHTGPIALDDSFGKPAPRSVGNVTGDGWECTQGGGAGTACLNANPLPAGETSVVGMNLTIPGLAAGGSFRNCVRQGVSQDADQQARTVQSALNAMGIDVGKVDGKIGPNTRRGITAAQEQLGLPATGKVSPELFAAMGLSGPTDAAPVCVTVDLPPMPQPPLVCQAATARKQGGECICRYKRMYQIDKSSCGCVKGNRFVAGKGCIRSQVSKPDKPRTRKCEQGFRLSRGKCVLIRQKKTTQCRPGYKPFGNACRRIIGTKPIDEDNRGGGDGGGGAGGP